MLLRLAGRRALTSVLFAALTVACLAPAHAGDPADAAAMQAMMEAATPGPHHAALAAKAGSYKTTSVMYMPGQPPAEVVGSSEMTSLMDGRFVQEVTKANMMGMPWEGRGVFGYDNVTGKHIGTWFDSFGTMMMMFEGTCKDHCKNVVMTSTYIDPATKAEKVMKSVSQDLENGNTFSTIYDVVDGKEIKMVEITYEPVAKQAKR